MEAEQILSQVKKDAMAARNVRIEEKRNSILKFIESKIGDLYPLCRIDILDPETRYGSLARLRFPGHYPLIVTKITGMPDSTSLIYFAREGRNESFNVIGEALLAAEYPLEETTNRVRNFFKRALKEIEKAI